MTAAVHATPRPVRIASEPPEARGLSRDDVRLLVATRAGVTHAAFRDLAGFLEPGDLVVVNTSGTLAAAVDGERAGGPVTVHLSSALADGSWAAELRPGRRATGPLRDVAPGDTVLLAHGRLHVLEPYPEPAATPAATRLWRCLLVVPGPVPDYLDDPMDEVMDYTPGTAGRSPTPTCPTTGRSRATRRCSAATRAAPRCPARAGRSPTGW